MLVTKLITDLHPRLTYIDLQVFHIMMLKKYSCTVESHIPVSKATDMTCLRGEENDWNTGVGPVICVIRGIQDGVNLDHSFLIDVTVQSVSCNTDGHLSLQT